MTVARGVLLVLLAAAVGAAVWVAGGMLLHLDEPVYHLGLVRVAVVMVAVAAVLMGAWMLVRSESARLPLLALVLAVCVVGALLAIASVGVLLMPPLVFFAVLLAREWRRQPTPSGGVIGAAFLVAVGLGVIVLAQPYTALVRCLPDGVVQNSSRLFGRGASSGGGSSSASVQPGGEAAGMVHSGELQYTYLCRDGRLVDFQRVGLPQR